MYNRILLLQDPIYGTIPTKACINSGPMKILVPVKNHKRRKHQSKAYHARIQKKWGRKYGYETLFERMKRQIEKLNSKVVFSIRSKTRPSTDPMPLLFSRVNQHHSASMTIERTKCRPPSSMHFAQVAIDIEGRP